MSSPPAPSTFAIVTGGGTAGHVLPALAIADALVADGHPRPSVHYAGAERGIEARLVRRIDYAGNVDDRISAIAKPVEAGRIFKRSGGPFHPVALVLLAAGESADLMAGFDGAIQQPRPDEAGRAGDGYL